MALIDNYLAHLVSQGGSDLHLSAGERVRIRVDGDLVEVSEEPLDRESLEQLLFEILEDGERQRFLQEKNLDKAYGLADNGNFRLNIFQTHRGIACVARSIPSKIPTLRDLGMPEVIERLTESEKGLILVTGATGSGKSTSLAAMINHINWHEPGHILTIEDPIEFVHQSKRSLINQRQIGQSCHSFSDALKYALREDPDVILVGEMRDTETISLALTAAETGHLVFGTLHTRGAASSVDRIIDSFTSAQQPMIRTMLAESLVAVVSQQLIKRVGGKGRVAAYEIMVVNSAISNLIREGKTFQIPSVMQTARREGMILMEQQIRDLILRSVISAEDGERYIADLAGPTPKKAGSVSGSSTVVKNVVPELMSEHTAMKKMPSLATVGRNATRPASAPPPIRSAPPAALATPPRPAPAGFAPLTAANSTDDAPRAKPNPPPKPTAAKAAGPAAKPVAVKPLPPETPALVTDLMPAPADELVSMEELPMDASPGLVDLTLGDGDDFPPRKKTG